MMDGLADSSGANPTMILKAGMLVKVREGLYDNHANMPPGRCGLLLRRLAALPHYTCIRPEPTDIWIVQMTNGHSLELHKMHLEPVTIT